MKKLILFIILIVATPSFAGGPPASPPQAGGSGDMTKAAYDTNDDGVVDGSDVATTVTITDNESTAEENPVVFVAGADPDGGNLGLETDGTCTYNPSTGVLTTTGFAGALTGNVTGNADTCTTASAGDSATAFFSSGAIEHEYGGLEADISAYSGLVAVSGGVTSNITDSAGLAGALSDETGSGAAVFASSPTLSSNVSFASGGVSVTGNNGTLTFLGLGDGFDEDLTFDLNTTTNVAGISSSTGVATISLGTINLGIGSILSSNPGSVLQAKAGSADATTYLQMSNTTGYLRASAGITLEPGTFLDIADDTVVAIKGTTGDGLLANGSTITSGNVLRAEADAATMTTGKTFAATLDDVDKFALDKNGVISGQITKSSITDNTATDIFTVTVPTDSFCAAFVNYTSTVSSGGHFQIHGGEVNLVLTNDGGTTTCDESAEIGETTVVSAGGGTLAGDSWACADDGTPAETFEFTINSSLDVASTLYYTVRLHGATGCVVTPL